MESKSFFFPWLKFPKFDMVFVFFLLATFLLKVKRWAGNFWLTTYLQPLENEDGKLKETSWLENRSKPTNFCWESIFVGSSMLILGCVVLLGASLEHPDVAIEFKIQDT